MANTILNFNFDYVHPSLRNKEGEEDVFEKWLKIQVSLKIMKWKDSF